jgi:hypothetical protein
MEFHKNIGLVLLGVDLFAFMFNVFTPSNPDHILNMTEQAIIAAVLILAHFAPTKLGQALQIVIVGSVAFIPVSVSDSWQWGVIVGLIALILIFAYDGYRTRRIWKFFATNAALFGLCIAGASLYEPVTTLVVARSLGQVILIDAICWLIWSVVEHREKTGAFAKGLIEQNRNILEELKRVVAELEKALAELAELKATKGGSDAVSTGKDRRS